MGKSPRIRHKGDLSTFVTIRSFGTNLINGSDYLFINTPTYSDGAFHGASVGHNSIMRDFTSDLYEFGLHPMQSVDHTYVSRSFGPRTITTNHRWFPFEGITEWNFARDGALWQRGDTLDLAFDTPSPPSSVLSAHSRKFLKESTRQFPAEVSLANTLLELKDIPQAIVTIKNAQELVADLFKNPRLLSVRRVADVHVGYNFGVAPLIGDITKIMNLLDIVNKRLAHLRRTKNKSTRVGSLTRYSEECNLLMGRAFGAGNEQVELVMSHADYEIRTTCKVRNQLSWLDTWEGIVRGMIGTLGLNNPASVIWNAIPWSWALDGFLPIGDAIETWSFEDVTAWLVTRLSTSIKARYTIDVYLTTHLGVRTKVGDFEITRYSRSIGMPSIIGGITAPTLKQSSIIAAIAIGRNG